MVEDVKLSRRREEIVEMQFMADLHLPVKIVAGSVLKKKYWRLSLSKKVFMMY
jgi:hypothetical protein